MMDEIQKRLLAEVADLHGVPVERLISTVPVWILTVHPGGVWKAEKSIQIITELPRMSMVGGISVMEK